MRQSHLIGVTASALLLIAGCSASQSAAGEVSALSPKREPAAGPEELRGTCPGLTMNLTAHVERMKALQAKAKTEAAAPPATVWGALQRFSGADSGGAEVLARERRSAEAINVALAQKGCRIVDIAEAMRAPPAPLPHAVKPKPR